MNRTKLALQAARAALRVRQHLRISPTSAICAFDAAQKLNLETWLLDVPSLDGMYVHEKRPSIFLGGHRPIGRQAMTCAHEIGHHIFGHGSQIDEVSQAAKSEARTPEEFLANTFAANFLITKAAVARGLLARGICASQATPSEVYQLAGWLGVSYAGLIYHMRSALKLLPRETADVLLRKHPADIRLELASKLGIANLKGELIVADQAWVSRPIDLQVGDVVVLPDGAVFDGLCCRWMDRVIVATTPGIGRVSKEQLGWSSFVRVSRRGYFGLAAYRHLEEVVDAQPVRQESSMNPTRHVNRAERAPGVF